MTSVSRVDKYEIYKGEAGSSGGGGLGCLSSFLLRKVSLVLLGNTFSPDLCRAPFNESEPLW